MDTMNTTYYFGAGASALVLPTYSDFTEKLDSFVKLFGSGSGFSKLSPEDRKIALEINRIGNEYLSNEQFSATPDRFARTEFSKGKSLKDLKMLLILFFAERQSSIVSINNDSYKRRILIDPRIDELMSHIIQPIRGKANLDPKFKILTWNYDFQFEMAFGRHSNSSGYHSYIDLQGFPNIDDDDEPRKFDNSRFSIVHLNGVAFFENGAVSMPFNNKISEEEQLVRFIIKYYYHIVRNYCPKKGGIDSLKFAFEYFDETTKPPKAESLDAAITIALNTKDLIISGYSFPSFNRDFDRSIFDNFVSLESVVIKDLPGKEQTLLKTVGNLLLGNFEKNKIEFDINVQTYIN